MRCIVSRAKKVQIFKWLLRKHDCIVELQRDFVKVHGKKIPIVAPMLFRRKHGMALKLVINSRVKQKKSEGGGFFLVARAVAIPCRDGIISYADVLDWILKLMKKNESDCRIGDSWKWTEDEVLLPKGTTIEALAIDFDVAGRDGLLLKDSKNLRDYE